MDNINPKNKRKTPRIHADAMMKYVLEETDGYFGGDICNLSPYGMCFETGYSIRPGVTLKIKIEETGHALPLWDKIHDCRARVKWCSCSPGHTAFSYRVGVEFLE